MPLGIPTLIIADDPQLVAAARAAYAHWSVEAPIAEPQIELRLEVGTASSAEGVSLDIKVEGSCLLLNGRGAVGMADSATKTGSARIAVELLNDPAGLADVLDTLLLFLLTRSGRTPIHASAFMLGNLALVLAGRSGSGKSTLALAAADRGYPILSDDTIFVQQEPSFALWGYSRPIHVFAADAPEGDHPTRLRSGKTKVAVPLPKFALRSEQSALILLERGAELALRAIRPSEAIESLMDLDPGFDLLEKEFARGIDCNRVKWRLAAGADRRSERGNRIGCKPAGALMRVIHANFIRPPHHADPDRLLQEWPTLLDVAAAVCEAGIEISILQSFARDAVIDRRGIKCRFVAEPAIPGAWWGLAPWRPARLAKAARPDVIHVNGLDFAAHTRAMTDTAIPVLVQDHGSRAGRGRYRRRWGLSRIAAAVFTDSAQARALLEEGSLSPRVRIFSVPESSTHFGPGDQKDAQKATSTFGDPLVLWVGRLDLNKDPLTMLDAIELAAPDLPAMQLWCCFHEQPMLEQVKARIARSPVLKEHVHLLGRVPHQTIELLCRAADIFIASSHYEVTGYALIESLACGAAPVVSDIPSFRRLRGDVGALARVGDAGSFAAALKRMRGSTA